MSDPSRRCARRDATGLRAGRALAPCVALAAALSGCAPDGDADPGRAAGPLVDRYLSRSIASIATEDPGRPYFDVTVDGTRFERVYPADGEETSVALDAALFRDQANAVTIDFMFESARGPSYPLAVAEALVPPSFAGERVRLSRLDYRFADSDGDGLLNVHELGLAPIDVDADGTENVYDADADGDGEADGVDPTPYGDGRGADLPGFDDALPLQSEFDEIEFFRLESVLGGTGEIDALIDGSRSTDPAQAIAPVPISPLNDEPGASIAVSDTRVPWTAIEISAGPGGLCPELDSLYDVESFVLSVDTTVMLYFNPLGGDGGFVLSTRSGSVADLGAYREPSSVPTLEVRPRKDSLRVVLVRRGSTGAIALWSEPGFLGDGCEIGLTTGSAVRY